MYDKEQLSALLRDEKYKTVNDNGKVLLPSNPVFKDISDAMSENGSCISSKHIHTIVNNNRSGMYDIVMHAFHIQQEGDESINNSVESTFNNSNTAPPPKNIKTDRFRLIISCESWSEIKPTSQNYGNRKFLTLKAGKWTHVFADKIWQQTKIPCSFSFKRAKVYESGDAKCYVKFSARCRECDACLTGYLYKKPRSKIDVVFECTLSGMRAEVTHKKKRQLKGYLREKIATDLLDGRKDARQWRIEEANRLMDVGDHIPPMLYDGSVLRKAKQEELDKRLQLTSSDVIKNLQTAKYTTHFRTLHAIGIDPFYCMYWTDEGKLMYQLSHKQDANCFLTIDATGGIGKKLELPNGEKSPHPFLYECMCISDLGSFPAFQMISAKHDAAIITYFLLEILRSGVPIPRVVVSDFGRAILIAIARAFSNNADLRSYMQVCYEIAVLNNKAVKVPNCFIRLDISHLMAMVARWAALKGKPSKVRQFYLRSIACIYQMDRFEDAEALLRSTLVVALSEETGANDDNELLASEVYLRMANTKLKGLTFEEPTELAGDSIDNIEHVDDTDNAGTWIEWARSVFNEAKDIASKSVDGNNVNAFYSPEVADKVRDLMSYLPLWTGIMRSVFHAGKTIASSAPVESEFSQLKNGIFKGKLPMRIDKFVLLHIDYINGRHRLASAGIKIPKTMQREISHENQTCESEMDTSREIDENKNSMNQSMGSKTCESEIDTSRAADENQSRELENVVEQNVELKSGNTHDYSIHLTEDTDVYNDHMKKKENESVETDKGDIIIVDKECAEVSRDSLNEIENWKGKIKMNNEPKTESCTKRSKPNYLDPCPDWDFVKNDKTVGIPLMKNGSLCNAVRVKGMNLIIRRTCAFDSLLQVVANAIGMYKEYALETADSKNVMIELAQHILKCGKIQLFHYTQRAQILCGISMFETTSCRRNIKTLDANYNVAHLAEEYIFKSLPSSIYQTSCNTCNQVKTVPLCTFNVNVGILLKEGFSKMQEAIDDVQTQTVMCKNCEGLATVETTYGSHLIIDTSIYTDEQYLESSNIERVPCTLKSVTKSVRLGTRTFNIAGVISYKAEHYVAFTYTGSWYLYNDLKAKRDAIRDEENVYPHMVVYTLASLNS